MDTEKSLFHYTSIEGLLGITWSNSIWATNVLHLNDASELNYSKELLRKELLQIKTKRFTSEKTHLENSIEPVFFEIIQENIEKLIPSEDFGFFVCSFSEEKDLLSQWRGYCPKGIGFSLGFKFSLLKECAEQKKFALKPCIYDERKQAEAIRNLLKKTSDRFKAEIRNSSEIWNAWDTKGKNLAVDFLQEFVRLAPTFKHPKFHEEKEWRIVASLKMKTVSEAIRFRPGQSMIVPYIEIFLPTEDGHLVINEIVVGPTNDRFLSKASVEMLLKARNVNYKELHYSTIPYRNW